MSKFSATSRNDIGSPCPSYGSDPNGNSTVLSSGKNVTLTMPSPAGFDVSTTWSLLISLIILNLPSTLRESLRPSPNLQSSAPRPQPQATYQYPPSQRDAEPLAPLLCSHLRPASSCRPAPQSPPNPSSTPQIDALPGPAARSQRESPCNPRPSPKPSTHPRAA